MHNGKFSRNFKVQKISLSLLLLVTGMWASQIYSQETGKIFSDIRAALFAGKTDRALEIAADGIKKYPNRAEPYYFRARIWDHQRKFERALEDLNQAIEYNPRLADLWQLRGIVHFQLAKPKESVSDFDQYLKYRPKEAPYHWQRGISLYYAKEFEKGVDQFSNHKSVNPTDVENVFWHFLCQSKATSAVDAFSKLIPLKPGDVRIPMAEIHGLLTKENSVESVIKKAEESGELLPAEKRNYLCYAHLYLGLYYEALGKNKLAKEHIKKAAVDYRQYHYMGDVARVHHILINKNSKTKSGQKLD